jgi:hypothetical protein
MRLSCLVFAHVCAHGCIPSSLMVPTPDSVLQDDWLRRAELAVQKGEDDLAKEALKRRKGYQVRGSRMDARVWLCHVQIAM